MNHCIVSAPISRDGYALIDDTNTAMFDNQNKNWLSIDGNHNNQDYYFLDMLNNIRMHYMIFN